MTFDVPAGAAPAGTMVEVAVVETPPDVAGVTAMSPVFEFGPAGTQFAAEVLVSFDVAGLSADAVPVVYWTNAAGAYEPQPTWWNGRKIHAVATHLSRAFVGTSSTPPASLLCCDGGACAGRGVCLLRAPLAESPLPSEGVVSSEGVTVRSLADGTIAPSSVVLRKSPVRPMALGRPSKGPVLDVDGALSEGAAVQVCVTVTLDVDERTDACLGFFDEANNRWVCQDSCLSSKDGQICGKTDHFTNFAILLGGGATSEKQCAGVSPCAEGTVRCSSGACLPRSECEATCGSTQTLCEDDTCADPGATCPVTGCDTDRPILCWDGVCSASRTECPAPTGCPVGHIQCSGGFTCARTAERCPAQ